MINTILISVATLAIIISYIISFILYRKLENQRIETSKLVREIALLKK